jgi:hypothetical protein
MIFRIYETLVSMDLGMKGKGETEEKITKTIALFRRWSC